ncbi:uncharacterized protein LOC122498686 [Leptopilina heterotoma]|uniref:uncharacterized protein LOC122498686 n=1 Tax=Leptopilina heterotoma TaxID=63436 RepID=UPI001CA8029D|nr:uncharacterized protein LOC122498686 [Leptopilina heterotoma]
MQPSCNRLSPSCFQTRTTSSTTSSLLQQQQQHHHQQQPQSFYGPVTLQPFTVLHPSCIYSAQRSTPNAALMTHQGGEWQTKTKIQGTQGTQGVSLRNQRQIFYSTKPSFPFEQQQINSHLPSSPSPYLFAASNICHGPYSTEQNNSGIVISQPYYKPPDVQALCLVQDRQFITQQQTHQYNPYYNLSSTLQTVTANTNLQLPTQLTPYPLTNQMFPNPPQNSIFNPLKDNRAMELSVKYTKTKPNHSAKFISRRNDYEETNPSSDYRQFCAEVQNKANSSTKTQDEHMSDDSSTSFDFTIEAEKMVSALCNTSSNDLENFDNKKNESLLTGAGDIGFSKNLSTNTIELTGTSIAIQTQDEDIAKYPELIRKTTIWGCNQAENLLNSGKCHRTTKLDWLMNLSIATRTAITKSSTCFSIFAGDQVLIQDLINSLLRISNGWLILDNYLNKQHTPSLNDKYDRNLIKSFQCWEGATHELLQNVINTFLLLEEKSEKEEIETSGTPGTFPGDVSIYTTSDLLEPPIKFNLAPGSAVISPSQNFQYAVDQKKGTKPKSKWTITESNSSGNSGSTSKKLDFHNNDTSLNAEFFHLKSKILEEKNANRNRNQILKFSTNTQCETKKTPTANEQIDFESIPINKMTLLSQIEPSSSASKKEEMTANLSAWFASMRNSKCESKINFSRNSSQEGQSARDKMDLTRQLQLDTNRQLLSLQNMQSIQSAPWNAMNLINNHNVQQRDECDSSEDVRIYMKPGSYNVPKKRHQKRSNRKSDSSRYGHRTSNKVFSIPKNENCKLDQVGNKCQQGTNDVTWKAACASAEVLLEALNVNETLNFEQQNMILEQNQEREVPECQMYGSNQTLSRNFEKLLLREDASKNEFKSRKWFCSEEILNEEQTIKKNVMFKDYQICHHLNEMKQTDRSRGPKTMNRDRDVHQDKLPNQFEKNPLPKNYKRFGKNEEINQQLDYIPYKQDFLRKTQDFAFEHQDLKNYVTMKNINVEEAVGEVKNENSDVKSEIRDRNQITNLEQTLENVTIKKEPREDELNKWNRIKEDRSQISKNELSQIMNEKIIENNKQIKELLKDQMIRNQNNQVIRNQIRRSKKRDEKSNNASSYEASEDDSEPSPKTTRSLKRLTDHKTTKTSKTNVKTDSWLIRTLNNANKTRDENNRSSTDSLNSSIHEDDDLEKQSNQKDLFPPFTKMMFLENPSENQAIYSEGRATYSETVRRSTNQTKTYKMPRTDRSTSLIFDSFQSGKKKEGEKSLLPNQRTRKLGGKRLAKDIETEAADNLKNKFLINETKSIQKTNFGRGRRKENMILDSRHHKSDRGWSVWYSSRKKQTLSPLAMRKLETIYQTIWKMDEACLFKCPTAIGGKESQQRMIENYSKIVKIPIFLETIEQKLKNRVYLKVEHAIKDFRKIGHNSRIYYKNDSEFSSKIDLLSKKLEELIEEHFSNFDFENLSSAGDDTSPVCQRFKLQSQRNRCNPSKKSITGTDKINTTNENLN